MNSFPLPLDANSALGREFDRLSQALARTSPSDAVFDRAAHSPVVISRLTAQWRQRQAIEYRSSMVFGQLAVQLFEANAPVECTAVMLRMAQDELRHALTCERVRRTLGDSSSVEVDSTVSPLARHEGLSARERALRNVIYTTCCSEMVACARFVATLDAVTDPFMQAAFRELLADEILHGQFGFHYLALEAQWLAGEPTARASTHRFLRHAFKVIEGELSMAGTFAPVDAAGRALGLEDAAVARALFFETMEGAVVPALNAVGLEATTAWRERALE